MERSEEHRELKGKFTEFLDQDHGHGEYPHKIREMISREQYRLLVDAGHLRAYDPRLADSILNHPTTALPALEEALDDVVSNIDSKFVGNGKEVHAGIIGSVGSHRVNPRSLLSSYLGKLVRVEGIVTKCSMIHPKVVKSVHYCEETGEFTTREYRDATAYQGFPTQTAYPTKDDNGNALTTEFGLCKYRDQQIVFLQEAPESAPAGQLPRSIDVILHDDLVDSCKPGDRVCITGIFKALPSRNAATLSGVFRTAVVGNATTMLKRENSVSEFSEEDIEKFQELSEKDPKDLLHLMGQSLAPSIYGHDDIKKALVLVLLGGVEKNLPNGTHLRGDINCLLVGDPSVAKSQLLRSLMHVAPLAVRADSLVNNSTTGRGSSGVGLTAAVTKDSETGDRKLEAGAMVLADRGIVCIDEFDKMGDADRVAIHEVKLLPSGNQVMEQQTVTVAKAGIHTSLNARCSVIAAANPKYGSYSHNTTVAENLNLPDSILSRFDLLFIMMDESDDSIDSEISDHVLRLHRYRPPAEEVMGSQATRSALQYSEENEHAEQGQEEMFVKYDRLLQGKQSSGKKRQGAGKEQLLHPKFFQKYIHYAKNRRRNLNFTQEASDILAEQYTEWRASADATYALPVSPRTLETMIRLSTAHAKLRLSKSVEKADAEAAVNLMSRVLRGTSWEDEEGGREDGGSEEHDTRERKRRSGEREAGPERRRQSQIRTTRQSQRQSELQEHGRTDDGIAREQDEDMEPIDASSISENRRNRFREALSHQFKFTDTLTVNEAVQILNAGGGEPFSKQEAKALFRELSENEPNSFLFMEDEEQFWLLS